MVLSTPDIGRKATYGYAARWVLYLTRSSRILLHDIQLEKAMRDYSEKRNAIRMLIGCMAEINNPGSAQTYPCTCRDLSIDGIAIESDYAANEGEMLEITLHPPENSAIAPLNAVMKVLRMDTVETLSGPRFRISGNIKIIS